MTTDVIKVGEYIVIQKQNYKKLHKLNKPNSNITLGRDNIILTGIEGCPFYSTFKMIPSSRKGREYRLERTNEVVGLKDEIGIRTSGADNRNIVDDGRSQKLTPAEIVELTNVADKASDIVETLISNSKTFHNKTEFSQEKYLKKKEKKYFEYIQILKPNLRMIAEVMYRLDPGKVQNIRIDTLSQIITMSNIQSDGNHLLYDSGSNGLLAAALLSTIGEKTRGKLIHMHPGNMSQKQAILAMNFSEEHLARCISVNIYSVLRQFYQGCDTNTVKKPAVSQTEVNPLKRKVDEDIEVESKISKLEDDRDVSKSSDGAEEAKSGVSRIENSQESKPENEEVSSKSTEPSMSKDFKVENTPNVTKNGKAKDITKSEPKKPKWHFDNIAAAEVLKGKMDSLIIACKEDPQSIFKELLPFVNPGRPFVVFYSVAEPLQNLYLTLKCQSNVAALKLTCNWLRNYQILPERTHPEVNMNGQSGFLLSGYVLE